MCNYPNRETAMVTIRRDENGTPTVWSDPCIAALVDALNTGDRSTVASCCGHDRIAGVISLRDGRHLLLLPDDQSLQAYRAWEGKTINDPIDAEPVIDWPADLTTRLEELTFPFTEDEDANLTGYGHQDKAEFADHVNRYDAALAGVDEVVEDDRFEADHITHLWVTHNDLTEAFTIATPDTPGAIPVTTLWGAR